MEVIMKLVSQLLFIFFMLGIIFVCLPQKLLAESSDDGITSFQLYQPKANQGDAQAQYNLALLYDHGVGTPQDYKQAVYWYTKAAEQGHVNSQYSLGQMYSESYSKEVPHDYKQAVFWYTKAAEQGYVYAQYNLGQMYRYGYGKEVPQDFEQAVFWYTKATEQGFVFAKENRDEILEMMSQSQVEEVQKLSKEFYEKDIQQSKVTSYY